MTRMDAGGFKTEDGQRITLCTALTDLRGYSGRTQELDGLI